MRCKKKKPSQSDSYLHIVTFVFDVKRHLTSLSVTHIQRRAEGEERGNGTRVGWRRWGGGVFSLQLISHPFPTPSISSSLSPFFYTICSYLSAFLNGFLLLLHSNPIIPHSSLSRCFQASLSTKCSAVDAGKLKVRALEWFVFFLIKNEDSISVFQRFNLHFCRFSCSTFQLCNNLGY